MEIPYVESPLIDLDDIPLDQLADSDDSSALTHALRHVVDVVRSEENPVAAFNNWISP